MVGTVEVGAPISLDGVVVHPDCWCMCLCYLHSAPKIQKMVKCTFWYRLTWVVPDKVQRAIKWLYVYVVRGRLYISCVRSSMLPRVV